MGKSLEFIPFTNIYKVAWYGREQKLESRDANLDLKEEREYHVVKTGIVCLE